MQIASAAWLFCMAGATSAFGGLLGMANGIFVVPALAVFGGVDLRTAIAASIVSVVACSCASAPSFLKAGLTNIRLAVVLEVATTLGALTGVCLVGHVPVSLLYGLFAAVLFVSAQQMLTRRRDQVGTEILEGYTGWADRLRLHASYRDPTLQRDVAYRVRSLPLGLALMYCAGVVSALLGIGSGVLKIPAMDTALRLPLKVSSATSNFMIGVTAAASGAAYLVRGDVVPGIAGPVVLGSVLGSILGARLLVQISGEKLRMLFVIVLVILGIAMLSDAFGVGLFGRPK